MSKIAAGLVLGLVIGAACRWLDIPVPSPPKIPGALLVLAMTIGYVAAKSDSGPIRSQAASHDAADVWWPHRRAECPDRQKNVVTNVPQCAEETSHVLQHFDLADP